MRAENCFRLRRDSSKQKLLDVLQELGIQAYDGAHGWHPSGYPIMLRLAGGQCVWLDLPEPALVSGLDPNEVGFAVVDGLGYSSRCWGLAEKVPLFREGKCLLDTDLLNLLAEAMRGSSGAVYLDGYRYFASPIDAGGVREILLLMTNAHEEQTARRQATKNQRCADALKRIGRALTMNQSLQPLCHFAVQEIASSLGLASALLWCQSDENSRLELRATIGANRKASTILEVLSSCGGISCAAEIATSTGKLLRIEDINNHPLTAELEASFCYLTPGPMFVLPLTIGNRLIGVLELIGRATDDSFLDHEDLCLTIAEHLALAINGANLYEATERLALFDPLTGIANHRSMHGFLNRSVAEAKRLEREVGLLMLDVDHFRSFNEEEGHDAGDQVLCMVADVLKHSIRPYDLAARYGGEEFTIIMPGNGIEASMAAAERIREKIEELEYVTRSGRVRKISASIGCAVYPESNLEPNELLKAADTALFQAKRSGRNRTRYFDNSVSIDIEEPTVPLDMVFQWLKDEDLSKGQLFQSRVANAASHLASRLGLSRSQEQILNALIYVTPSFLKAREEGDMRYLQRLESIPELRPLVPSLSALFERFDGGGPAKVKGQLIPLLGRILAVLVMLDRDPGELRTADEGRYDPEVVGIALSLEDAA